MDAPKPDELQAARRPLASLLSKSEKAQQKLASGTWQHAMLCDNVSALRVALALMDKAPSGAGSFMRADLQKALCTLASVAARACKAQSKFAAGTSQYTLQQNRISALRVAEALVSAELCSCDAEAGAAPDPAA